MLSVGYNEPIQRYARKSDGKFVDVKDLPKSQAIDVTRYKCPDCGWIGTENEMEADYIGGYEGESWSNWICPQCQTWWRLDDYEVVQ
jgi:rubredoxin